MASSPEITRPDVKPDAQSDHTPDNDAANLSNAAGRIKDQVDTGHIQDGFTTLQNEYTTWMLDHKGQNSQTFFKTMESNVGEHQLQDLSIAWADQADSQNKGYQVSTAIEAYKKNSGNSLKSIFERGNELLTPDGVKLLEQQRLNDYYDAERLQTDAPTTSQNRLFQLMADHHVSDDGPDGRSTTEEDVAKVEARMLPPGYDVSGKSVDTRIDDLWTIETHPDYLGTEMASHLEKFVETDPRENHPALGFIGVGDSDSPGKFVAFNGPGFGRDIMRDENIANARQTALSDCSSTDASPVPGSQIDAASQASVKQIEDQMAKGNLAQAADTLDHAYTDWHVNHPDEGSSVFWQYMQSKDGIGDQKMDQLALAWADSEPNYQRLAYLSHPDSPTKGVTEDGIWLYHSSGQPPTPPHVNSDGSTVYYARDEYDAHAGDGNYDFNNKMATQLASVFPYEPALQQHTEGKVYFFNKSAVDSKVDALNQQNAADAKTNKAICGT